MKRIDRVARLVLCAISVAMAAPAVAAPADGKVVFRQRCQMCHSVVEGGADTPGPNLKGVMGRKAAIMPFGYSPALAKSKLVWTSAVLDKFLAGPAKLVPGTRMVIALPDPAQRAAVIKYLTGVR